MFSLFIIHYSAGGACGSHVNILRNILRTTYSEKALVGLFHILQVALTAVTSTLAMGALILDDQVCHCSAAVSIAAQPTRCGLEAQVQLRRARPCVTVTV